MPQHTEQERRRRGRLPRTSQRPSGRSARPPIDINDLLGRGVQTPIGRGQAKAPPSGARGPRKPQERGAGPRERLRRRDQGPAKDFSAARQRVAGRGPAGGGQSAVSSRIPGAGAAAGPTRLGRPPALGGVPPGVSFEQKRLADASAPVDAATLGVPVQQGGGGFVIQPDGGLGRPTLPPVPVVDPAPFQEPAAVAGGVPPAPQPVPSPTIQPSPQGLPVQYQEPQLAQAPKVEPQPSPTIQPQPLALPPVQVAPKVEPQPSPTVLPSPQGLPVGADQAARLALLQRLRLAVPPVQQGVVA